MSLHQAPPPLGANTYLADVALRSQLRRLLPPSGVLRRGDTDAILCVVTT